MACTHALSLSRMFMFVHDTRRKRERAGDLNISKLKTFCALYHYIEASQTEICLSNGLTIRKQQPEKKRMDKSIVYANICVRYKYAIAYNHAAF